MNNEKVQNIDSNTACVNESTQQHPAWYNLKYAAVGIIFGIVFVKVVKAGSMRLHTKD